MTEIYPIDAELNDLSGTTDSEQEVLFVPMGESPYYTSFYKMLYRLLNVARRAGDLRVFKDGDLTFGVRAGKWLNGESLVEKAQVNAQALTNNATNYIYYTAGGTLTVNTTGFPVASVTPHIPLAAITTSAGNYSELDGDIIDCRGRSMFQVCGAAAGSLKLLDWQESLKDELNFTTLEPASPAIGDRYLNTATGSSSVRGQSVTANRVYQWNGASWTETTPTEGAAVLVEDRDMLIGYNGSAWVDIGTFALLNEAQAFFSATNITGAEAETLTNASNADALHVHGASGLQANAVTTAKIADDAVDKTKIAADLAGNGLGQNADGSLEVKVDGTGIEINADTLRLKDGGVATAKIAADAVDKTKINADVAGSGLVQNPDGSLEIYPDDSTVEISADMLKLKDGGVTAAKLAAAVQDLMPNLLLTGANHADGTGAMTIQARDAANNNLAQRFLVRAWIADAEYSEPDPQTGFSVTTGELMRTIEANADLEVISDATGLAAMDINTGGAKTVYVMAKVDGRIYTGSVSITGP